MTYAMFILKLYKSLVEPVLYYGAGLWVIRTGEKCKLFKTRHVDYFSPVRLIRQMLQVKDIWDIIVPNRLNH
jgi:hypothetical protein